MPSRWPKCHFTLRDVFWFTLLAALLLTWWREGLNLDSEKRNLQDEIRHAVTERDSAVDALRKNEPYYIAEGWHTVGDPDHCEIGLDHEIRHTGKSSAYIKATAGPHESAALIQSIRADEFGGQRVRLSAYIKTENANYTFLLLRLWSPKWSQEAKSELGVGPDKMIQPTTDWNRYQLELDIPSSEWQISFGMMAGDGVSWIDDVTFESIGPAASQGGAIFYEGAPVRKPRLPKNFPLPIKPLSLDFDD